LSDRKLKPLPPDPACHQDSAIAQDEQQAAFDKIYLDGVKDGVIALQAFAFRRI
jgi:hypothetical protein